MPPVTIRLVGLLTPSTLHAELERGLGEGREPGQPASLVMDCQDMTDYELGCRELLVSWAHGHRALLARIAVVTDRPLWHMVVYAMAVSSGLEIRPFAQLEDAIEWADHAHPWCPALRPG